MVYAAGVGKADVVFGKSHLRQLRQRDAIGRRVFAHGRMHGAAKAVKEAALNTTGLKQLAHIFQRVHRVLHGLAGESVHQIGVHQNARVGKALGHPRHLGHGHAFFHQIEQPV